MPNQSETTFEKPEIVKTSDRILLEDGKTALRVQHVIYNVNGKKYPKAVISVFTVGDDGFPTSRAKTLGLPVDISKEKLKELVNAIISVKE